MKRIIAMCIAASFVAGCGVDGEPTRPEPGAARDTSGPSISISGRAEVGITG
ncbi:argininosuccinate lyase [Litoreibacter roseus]|uniref:argininosuccinate lyase n=1 Tax=Litoreibacter roseus TaxID=2601869 RepID=UPI001FA9DABC|nr:argininosuccinate lyase [Litoreibacter roseus]